MPQTRTSCPRCRQPVIADVEQLFDVTSDPEAKQRLLSGAVNHRLKLRGFSWKQGIEHFSLKEASSSRLS